MSCNHGHESHGAIKHDHLFEIEPFMSTICLNMIVRNEAAIIEQTLDNIVGHMPIDYWVIADTGSTDDTAAIITDFFHKRGIAGQMVHHVWQDFGHNRQLALDAAQGLTDYVFFFDADDRFHGQPELPQTLTSDAYSFKLCAESPSARQYCRSLMVKNDGSWYWEGVIHELIVSRHPDPQKTLIHGDYVVVSGRFGSRNRDYLADAQILAQAYERTTEPHLKTKYAYFCAQSYRDAGQPQAAIEWFKRNISHCTEHTEPIRFSLVALGNLYQQLGMSADAVQTWLYAYDHQPHHAESLVILAEHFLAEKRYQLAFDCALKSTQLPWPSVNSTIVFDENVFRYGSWNALLRSALPLQKWDVAYQATKHLLNEPEYDVRLNHFLLSALILLSFKLQQESAEEKQKLYQKIKTLKQIDPPTKTQQQKLIRLLKPTSSVS